MASNALAGIAYISINGTQYYLKANFKIRPTTLERTGVVGADGVVHGYIQKGLVPGMDMDLTDTGGLSLQALQALDGVNITAELINGKVYTATNAWYAKLGGYDGIEGSVSVSFDATQCGEVLAGALG